MNLSRAQIRQKPVSIKRLNLETLNTILSGTEPTIFEPSLKFKPQLKFFNFGLCIDRDSMSGEN